jgi:ABC-type nickel/cobalt efflux system permease component RcnA
MIAETLSLLGIGFVLGIQHALDPDHLVTMSSLVSKHKSLKKASLLGIFWGLGHTTTLFVAGLLLLILKITIPQKLALSFEFIVGFVIMILGITVIKDLILNKKHIHKHMHEGEKHLHFHEHKKTENHNHLHKSFFIGTIHGMAGSAALMLLVLSTVNSIYTGLGYILIFGIGSITGMFLASGVISVPFVFTSQNFVDLNRKIRYFAGTTGILFGIFIMIKIGFFEGLF